jgi:hypothetical protein
LEQLIGFIRYGERVRTSWRAGDKMYVAMIEENGNHIVSLMNDDSLSMIHFDGARPSEFIIRLYVDKKIRERTFFLSGN